MQTFKYYECLHDDIYVTFYLLFYDIFLPISYDSSKRCKNAFKSQGMKQLMAGGGVALIGGTLVPLLSGLFG